MKDYNLGILSAGQTKTVNALGNYIRNIGQGSLLVEAVNDKAQSVKAFKTVIGAGGARSPESDYTQWQITNNSIIAIDVSVLIGKGEASESEVQITADVNAQTVSKNQTAEGNQYTFNCDYTGADNWKHMQLFNPVGSGVIVKIKDFNVSTNTGTSTVQLYSGNAALANATMPNALVNKKDGAQNSNAVFRTENIVATVPVGDRIIDTVISSQLFPYSGKGSYNYCLEVFNYAEGSEINLSEGMGLNMLAQTVMNVQIQGQFSEEAV